jgi:hypothetical protein
MYGQEDGGIQSRTYKLAWPISSLRGPLVAPDRPGLAASVTAFVAEHGGNIVEAEPYGDAEAGVFFQRVEFNLQCLHNDRIGFTMALDAVTEPLHMTAWVQFSDDSHRIGSGSASRSRSTARRTFWSAAARGRCQPRSASSPENRDGVTSVALGRWDLPFHPLQVSEANQHP